MALERDDIRANKSKIIENIRNNYKPNRPPEIVEPIQNSQDAYANLLSEGILNDQRSLSITYHFFFFRKTIEITDNAGGMSHEVMADVVPEIDKTSDLKSQGNSVGSEGRGLFAVAANATKMYIETFNTDNERLATIIYPEDAETLSEPRQPQEVAEDNDESVIQAPKHPSPEGTYLKLAGVQDDRLSKLADWDFVESVLAEMFTPLFSRDDVELVYRIEEGDSIQKHTPDLTPINDLVEDRVREIDEHHFTAEGEKHVLTDVVFGSAAEDYPWDGIAFLRVTSTSMAQS